MAFPLEVLLASKQKILIDGIGASKSKIKIVLHAGNLNVGKGCK